MVSIVSTCSSQVNMRPQFATRAKPDLPKSYEKLHAICKLFHLSVFVLLPMIALLAMINIVNGCPISNDKGRTCLLWEEALHVLIAADVGC